MAAKERDDILDDEKFQARNWKQYTERQLQKLHPVQRSRYLAYEPPSDQNGMSKSKNRLMEEGKRRKIIEKERLLNSNEDAMKKHEIVLGQLKASEASQRVKSLKKVYQNNRTAEINHLIYTQQTAIKAVRLQSLLPPIPTRIKFKDSLVKEQRMRVEVLMEDDLGLQTTRKLC